MARLESAEALWRAGGSNPDRSTRLNCFIRHHHAHRLRAMVPALHMSIAHMPESVALVRLFAGECCFQVIYFVSNIFFISRSPNGPASRVETIRLTRTTNNRLTAYGLR